MLRSLRELMAYKIHALDGELGKVTGFLFDDQHWTIRYMIVDTSGFWESRHRVLISPISFRQADWTTKLFHLSLTQEKIKNSPDVDLAKPVSRQYERDYSKYYGWPYYWGFGGLWAWGLSAYPMLMTESVSSEDLPASYDEKPCDPHLHSVEEVTGYHICGSDEQIGHVADFLVDDETWAIRYLVIDTSNWWFGKEVLIAPHWAHEISWARRMVYVNLTKEEIKNGPTWNKEFDRQYEERLYEYYGRPRYWPRSRAAPKNKASGIIPAARHL